MSDFMPAQGGIGIAGSESVRPEVPVTQISITEILCFGGLVGD